MMLLNRTLPAILCLAFAVSAFGDAIPVPRWQEPPAVYPGKHQWGIRSQKVPLASLPELLPYKEQLADMQEVLVIKGFLPGGTGKQEGLQPGDILLRIAGKPAVGVSGFPTQVNVREYDRDYHEEMLPVTVWQKRDGKGEIREMELKYGRYYGTERIE